MSTALPLFINASLEPAGSGYQDSLVVFCSFSAGLIFLSEKALLSIQVNKLQDEHSSEVTRGRGTTPSCFI